MLLYRIGYQEQAKKYHNIILIIVIGGESRYMCRISQLYT